MLEDDADEAAKGGVLADLGAGSSPPDAHAARRRAHEPDYDAAERRLTTATLSDQRHDFATPHAKGHIVARVNRRAREPQRFCDRAGLVVVLGHMIHAGHR